MKNRRFAKTVEPVTFYPNGLEGLMAWFASKGWKPWDYQLKAWEAFRNGESGLIHLPTGSGKTLSAYGGPFSRMMETPQQGVYLLYITPLRAVARDIEKALLEPLEALKLPLTVQSRTGDTSAAVRNRQQKRLPNILITTPESLNLLLTRQDAASQLGSVQCVIVDEWHELLGSKRGTQMELALSRLRRFSPRLQVWGVTATLPNLAEAAEVLVGPGKPYSIIQGDIQRPVILQSLIPQNMDTFPWAGHLGLTMLKQVIDEIDFESSTLIFTNTRSQTERWYQALIDARPDWIGQVALHHSSLDKRNRRWVEAGLKEGYLKVVVCTSSLDLGVDFSPVSQVIQVGSPKGVNRLIQRAGRSSHQPGKPCRILCVPTHAFELLEYEAVRHAITQGHLEARRPLKQPLDVLVQHMMTCALGGGFTAKDLYEEVKGVYSYAQLSWETFLWALDLLVTGGRTLYAYPDYHRLQEEEGHFRVISTRLARLHRLNVGTILGDSAMEVRFLKGGRLGTIEESFLTKLHPGDVFLFSGRLLELVSIRETTAYVKLSKKPAKHVPAWQGGRLAWTPILSRYVRRELDAYAHARQDTSPEHQAMAVILQKQAQLSAVPRQDELLIELFESRDGSHLFVFPFDGIQVHEGMAALLALRLSQQQRATFSIMCNDYCFSLFVDEAFPLEGGLSPELFSPENLERDLVESCNVAELAKRHFREVARVSGMVFTSYPGRHKSMRQIQTSTSLLYDVFRKYDPENLLLMQATHEMFDRYLDQQRLAQALTRLSQSRLVVQNVKRPTPLAFPLFVDRLAAKLSTESLQERIERLKRRWSKI